MSYGGQDVSSGGREVTATAVRDEERTSMQGGGCLMLVPGGDARSAGVHCRGPATGLRWSIGPVPG